MLHNKSLGGLEVGVGMWGYLHGFKCIDIIKLSGLMQ
jgi:hypothetical protein